MITLYEGGCVEGALSGNQQPLFTLYQGHGASGTLYAPQPSRARKWLHYGLDKNWAMATTGC